MATFTPSTFDSVRAKLESLARDAPNVRGLTEGQRASMNELYKQLGRILGISPIVVECTRPHRTEWDCYLQSKQDQHERGLEAIHGKGN